MTRIELLTILDPNFPDSWKNPDGRVYLDTFAGLDIRASRQIIRVNEFTGNARRDTTEAFSLPDTKKNRFFLGEEVVSDQTFSVAVYVDGVWIPYSEMIVSRYDERDGSFEVELLGNNLLERLDGLSLREIELGGILYNRSNVEATWDGTGTALFAPVHYNQWLSLNEDPPVGKIQWRDLRPLYRLGDVLNAIFLSVGYRLDSPFFQQTDVGSNLFAYLLKGAWGRSIDLSPDAATNNDIVELRGELNDQQAATVYLPAGTTADLNRIEGDVFWNVVTPLAISGLTNVGPDIKGRYSDPSIALSSDDAAGRFTIEGRVILRRVETSGTYDARLGIPIIHRYTNAAGQEEYRVVSIAYVDYNASTENESFFFFNRVDLILNRFGGIFFVGQPRSITLDSNTPPIVEVDLNIEVKISFTSFLPIEGTFLNYADTMTLDYTAMEVVEGAMHLIDGVLTVDEINRSVRIDVPDTVAVPTRDQTRIEQVSGLFQLTLPAKEYDVVPKSLIVTRNESQFNALKLDFRSGDQALEVFSYAEDQYAYTVGRRNDTDEVDNSENPIFLRTMDVKMQALEQDGIEDTAILPAIWGGSTDDNLFYEELGARVLLFYGNGPRNFKLNYEDIPDLDVWPYVSQYPGENALNKPLPMTYSFFGSIFYENNPLRRTSPVEYEVLVHLGLEEFLDFDFGSPIAAQNDNGSVVYYPLEIVDFSTAYGGPTPLKVRKVDE